jgi:hypothetical protein
MVNDGANRLSLGPNGDFFVSMADPNQVVELARDDSVVRIFGAQGEHRPARSSAALASREALTTNSRSPGG